MAFEMEYSDRFGSDNVKSYWRLSSFTFDRLTQSATFHFHGWTSQKAHDSNDDPIDLKSYTLTGDDYKQVANLLQSGFGSQVYQLAKQIKDQKVDITETGEPVYDSFFAKAKDVI